MELIFLTIPKQPRQQLSSELLPFLEPAQLLSANDGVAS